jgi:hypothetical protein
LRNCLFFGSRRIQIDCVVNGRFKMMISLPRYIKKKLSLK